MNRGELLKNIFNVSDDQDFLKCSLDVFNFQYCNNLTYRKFVDGCKISPAEVDSLIKIPFLPIDFYKSLVVKTNDFLEEKVFTSSGTTAALVSKHFVRDLSVYENSFLLSFEMFYGIPEKYVFLALLPSYLERTGSSLIYMIDKLINLSGDSRSGFFLYDHEKLRNLLLELKKEEKNVILIGVTYALLDFAKEYQIDFPELIVMETGGMKGKRKEMVRDEVHQILMPAFNVGSIHSEYGMTELLSQAYSKDKGVFNCPEWMKVLIRDMYDPFQYCNVGATGGINVIDLANLDSCSFIATQDLGKKSGAHSFEIVGRYDASDIRGCNLMIE